MKHADDGTVSELRPQGVIPEGEVPFNLETLRRHLSHVVLARRVLSEDVALRQKLLEQSVYNVAVERMKHQADMLDKAGLPSKGLQSNNLKAWMWEWHQKLVGRIQAELENLVVEERVVEKGETEEDSGEKAMEQSADGDEGKGEVEEKEAEEGAKVDDVTLA